MSTLTRTKIGGILRFIIPIAFAVLGLLAIRARGAEPAGTIRGIVRDEQGAALAGVKVQLCGLEKLQNGTWHRELRLDLMPSYTTDKEGRFVVPVNEADLRLDFYCDLPGYAPTFLDMITNNAPELKVVLKRGLTVTGTVKRMARNKPEPVAGTQVELRLPTEDLWYQQSTMTDHEGKYMFHVSPPANGKKWQVVFAGEVVQLDVKEGQPVMGPDFEVTVKVSDSERDAANRSAWNFQPKAGFVPDAETAIKIAVSVWEPIYGKANIADEKPYQAVLSNGVWVVDGSLSQNMPGRTVVGGTAHAEIAKADGRILSVFHWQ